MSLYFSSIGAFTEGVAVELPYPAAHSVDADLQPVVLANEIPVDQIRQLPPGLPVRRYLVGQGVVNGATAGATGTEVYRNAIGTFVYPPGTGVRIADDILTVCTMVDLTFIEIKVSGGGDGSGAGFDVAFELYSGCPSQGGIQISGTQQVATLPDDGVWLVSLDTGSMPVTADGSFWLALSVSNDQAGWILAGVPAEIGHSDDIFDGAFPCQTFLGGCPLNPCANFYVDIYGQNCQGTYIAYLADAFSGFFIGMLPNEQFADDVLPISSPGLCDITQYRVALAGLDGTYTMTTEIWTDADTTSRPFAPVLGTQRSHAGIGNGFLEQPTYDISPPIPIVTARFWIAYDVNGNGAGPILAADFPSIGFSADAHSIFGNPDPGMWSEAIWWYGGCPQSMTGAPCGTFQARVSCAGSAMASCCKPEGSCENLTSDDCGEVGGLWQIGQSCGFGKQTCPPISCITATNACNVVNNKAGGCVHVECCATVCSIDIFCCDTAWDSGCVDLASSVCEPTAQNDACVAAIEIADGTFNFDTSLATTDGPALPSECDEQFGLSFGKDIWYDFTASLSGLATATLCNGTAYDSRMSVYAGCACPVSNEALAACNDDNCGDPVVLGGASAVGFPVTAGSCYKIRIGGFGTASGSGTMTVTTTPAAGCTAANFIGGCLPNNNLSCPDNWDLPGDAIPNNSPPDTYCVTLDDLPGLASDDVLVDISVVIDSLQMTDSSVLRVTQNGSGGNLTIATDAGLNNFGSTILVNHDRTLNVPLGTVQLRGEGVDCDRAVYMKDPSAPMGSVTASLSCQTLHIRSGADVVLEDSMSVTTTSDLVIDGTDEPPCLNDGGKTWPKLKLTGTSIGVVAHDFQLLGTVEFLNESLVPIMIGGDFGNQSNSAHIFNSEQGSVNLNGTDEQVFEVAGVDVGRTPAGFSQSGSTNFSLGRLEIATNGPGHSVVFRNDFANTVGTDPGDEALYVHELVLGKGTVVTLDDARVYYETLVDEGATMNVIGVGELLAINSIVASTPPDGGIDARQPSPVDSPNPPQGWNQVTLHFMSDTSGLDANDFLTFIDPAGGPAPIVVNVAPSGNDAVLTFDTVIPTGKWTHVTHTESGTSIRLGFLPGDVNNDRISGPVDILRLIDRLNNVCDPPPPPCEYLDFQSDINRSNLTEPSDILREIDLLNGAGVYDVWNGQVLPP